MIKYILMPSWYGQFVIVHNIVSVTVPEQIMYRGLSMETLCLHRYAIEYRKCIY